MLRGGVFSRYVRLGYRSQNYIYELNVEYTKRKKTSTITYSPMLTLLYS